MRVRVMNIRADGKSWDSSDDTRILPVSNRKAMVLMELGWDDSSMSRCAAKRCRKIMSAFKAVSLDYCNDRAIPFDDSIAHPMLSPNGIAR